MKNKMDSLVVAMMLRKNCVMEKLQQRRDGDSNYLSFFVLIVVVAIIAGVVIASAKNMANTATTGGEAAVKNLFDNILK